MDSIFVLFFSKWPAAGELNLKPTESFLRHIQNGFLFYGHAPWEAQKIREILPGRNSTDNIAYLLCFRYAEF